VALNSKSYRRTLVQEVAEVLRVRKGEKIAFIQEDGKIYNRKT